MYRIVTRWMPKRRRTAATTQAVSVPSVAQELDDATNSLQTTVHADASIIATWLQRRAWAHWAVRAAALLGGSGALIAALLWLPRVQSMAATVVLAAAATVAALGAALWLVANRPERPQARS